MALKALVVCLEKLLVVRVSLTPFGIVVDVLCSIIFEQGSSLQLHNSSSIQGIICLHLQLSMVSRVYG